MKAFLDKDFLLGTPTAQKLFHTCAKGMPIVDYHCHLSAREIFEDRHFSSITELWLGGDHYKWRLERSFGIEERFITGAASDREKFCAWASALETAIGNPLYHWSHLELKNYFGFEGHLTKRNANAVYDLCNRKLQEEGFSARALIERSGVRALCTTDDPADSLQWHEKLKNSDFSVKVLPSFRPDRALGIEKSDYLAYLRKLGTITDFAQLKAVLAARLDFFVSLGCRVSDHGLREVPFAPASEEEIENIFAARLRGEIPSKEQQEQFQTALLLFLGSAYAQRGLVMQLHFGVMRDLNKKLYRTLGADAGIDSIGDAVRPSRLAAFLNALEEKNALPKTVLYSLNPNDNAAIESVMGAFQCGEAQGKLQHGSAWWFNDHERGMREHLASLASLGHLGTFVGMLTDSRSFLSYARHEYFRRILCDVIGTWVEEGRFPADEELLERIIRGICFENAQKFFGF